MKWFIILACFLAAQFAHGELVTVITEDSDTIYLHIGKLPESFSSCTITTNTGDNKTLKLNEVVQLSKNLSCELSHNYFAKDSIKLEKGEVNINGKWIVQINTEDGNLTVYQFFIYIKKRTSSKTETIDVYEGHYAIYKYPIKFNNLDFCFLSKTDSYGRQTGGYDILSAENSYLRLGEPDTCGIQIKVNGTEHNLEHWSLYASDVNSNETHEVKIAISHISKQNEDMEPEYFQLGKKHSIKFEPSERSVSTTFCQLEDPTGKIFPIQTESCSYEIPYVTKLHEGVWKIYYGIKGSIGTLETTKKIITYDQLNSSVTRGQNNQINLLCQIRDNWNTYNSKGIIYCLFTKPDNTTFSITPGIADEKYEYYGEGEKKGRPNLPDIYDCGVTIKSPSTKDFGTWKCTINMNNQLIGTILNVDNYTMSNRNEQSSSAVNKIVFVQKGNSFTIMCNAKEVLDYCWMLSPNGTIYSVSKNGSSPSDLVYKGSGLEFGECGAVVEVADDTHQGEWSCRMGVLNKTEMASVVSVTVTDSLLITDENTIDIKYKTPTTLNCRVLPGYDYTINYCRWIRPDGLGIYNNVDNTYVTKRTLSSCKLTIQDINVEQDIGSWFCVAGISGVSGERMKEVSSRIQINYSSMGLGGTISVTLVIGLLIITTVTLFIIIVRKRRNRQPDEKILHFKS